MNTELLKKIEALAGDQRRESFRMAAELILEHGWKWLVETGCYRGISADGMSTLILTLLAEEVSGNLMSYEVNPEHAQRANALLVGANAPKDRVAFVLGDSVTKLGHMGATINFAYLDSFDHDPTNPGPCQRHQLAELGAIYGKLSSLAAILLDDCDFESGGKCLLSHAFLMDRGWRGRGQRNRGRRS